MSASLDSYNDVSFVVDDCPATDVCPTIDIDVNGREHERESPLEADPTTLTSSDIDVNGREHERESPLESDPTALTASTPEPLEEELPPTTSSAVLVDEAVREDDIDYDELMCSDMKDEALSGDKGVGGGGEGTGRLSVEAESFTVEPARAPLAFLSPTRYGSF